MKYFFSLFLFLLTDQALALSPVVRVDLSACQWQGRAHFSGVLVEQSGKHYVLTSSWAQMSSQLSGPRCEKVWSQEGELQVLPLVTDHLAGLALYEVLSVVGGLSAPQGDENSAQVWTLETPGLQRRDGDIVIAGSKRHHLPSWDRVLEWQGDAISSQGIGAGVWKNAQWSGIVSHEFLKLVPGAKTKTVRWSLKELNHQDHLVVISATDVLNWLQKQVLHPEEPVLWRPEDQRAGLDRWVVGDLEFTTFCPNESEPNPGGQYPIGGNDGFGIGGDSALNKACKVQVANAQYGKSSWLPASLQVWRNQSQQVLAQQQDISFWYGLSRNSQGLTRDYFYSTESLVKSSLDNSKKWIAQIPGLQPASHLLALVQSAQDLKERSLHCYSQLFIREQNVQELVRRLFFFSMVAESQSWQELRPEDMSSTMDLKGTYSQGWKTLSWIGACDTPQLRATAEKFSQEHQKVWAP